MPSSLIDRRLLKLLCKPSHTTKYVSNQKPRNQQVPLKIKEKVGHYLQTTNNVEK
jgi:hypothetical protein